MKWVCLHCTIAVSHVKSESRLAISEFLGSHAMYYNVYCCCCSVPEEKCFHVPKQTCENIPTEIPVSVPKVFSEPTLL